MKQTSLHFQFKSKKYSCESTPLTAPSCFDQCFSTMDSVFSTMDSVFSTMDSVFRGRGKGGLIQRSS